MADYFEVLEVARTATDDEIKSAYRKLAMRWHPDRNNGSKESEERFKAITEAYDVLRDPEENDNLWDQLGDEGPRRLALLDAYVKAHSKSRADFERED